VVKIEAKEGKVYVKMLMLGKMLEIPIQISDIKKQ
jgi:hypothetical protein